MIKLAGKSRLTKAELEDIRENSGITNLQYEIVRLRYYDPNQYSVVKICDILKIGSSTYEYQMHLIDKQVNSYLNNK